MREALPRVREGCLEEVIPRVSVFLPALSYPLGSWEPWSPGSQLVSRPRTPDWRVDPRHPGWWELCGLWLSDGSAVSLLRLP